MSNDLVTGMIKLKGDETSSSPHQQRTKARMSVAERRQARKKRVEATVQTSRTFATPMEKAEEEEAATRENPAAALMTEPSIISQKDGNMVMVALRKEIDAQVARQLSDSSNFVAQRCLQEREDENPNSVQRYVLDLKRRNARCYVLTTRTSNIEPF